MAKSCLALNKDGRKEKTENRKDRKSKHRGNYISHFEDAFPNIPPWCLSELLPWARRSGIAWPDLLHSPFPPFSTEFPIEISPTFFLEVRISHTFEKMVMTLSFSFIAPPAVLRIYRFPLGPSIGKSGLTLLCDGMLTLPVSLSKKTVISTHPAIELSTKPTDYAARSAYV